MHPAPHLAESLPPSGRSSCGLVGPSLASSKPYFIVILRLRQSATAPNRSPCGSVLLSRPCPFLSSLGAGLVSMVANPLHGCSTVRQAGELRQRLLRDVAGSEEPHPGVAVMMKELPSRYLQSTTFCITHILVEFSMAPMYLVSPYKPAGFLTKGPSQSTWTFAGRLDRCSQEVPSPEDEARDRSVPTPPSGR